MVGQKTKRNETKRNETKQNKTKQNKTKQKQNIKKNKLSHDDGHKQDNVTEGLLQLSSCLMFQLIKNVLQWCADI